MRGSPLRPTVVAPIEWAEPVRAPAAAVAPFEPALSVPAPAQAIEAHDQPPTSNRESEVRVTADLANLRGGPGTEHTVVGQTRRGDTLQLLERRNRWLHVRLGELDAWLHVSLAEELSPNEATVSRTTRQPATLTISDDSIRQALVQQSIASYAGSCPCPYNIDRGGRRCGGRSAYSRQGGASPYCYSSDVPGSAVAAYRNLAAR
jgi:Bacterial SH3 domain